MARSRDIRPEFFTDEKVGELPYGARLLFIGIWCHSDFNGVFEYSAKQLRVLVFPFDEGLTSVSVQEWLSLLESHGMLARFEADGKTWGHVCKWRKHQKPSSRERDIGTNRPMPLFPGRPQADPRQTPGGTQASSPSPSPAPTPSPAPSPSPACSGDPEDYTATAATAPLASPPGEKDLDIPTAVHRFRAANTANIRAAAKRRDLLGIVRAFGANPDFPEWGTAANALQLGVVVAIFGWSLGDGVAIRAPSGFAKARAEWGTLNAQDRAAIAIEQCRLYGISIPPSERTPEPPKVPT